MYTKIVAISDEYCITQVDEGEDGDDPATDLLIAIPLSAGSNTLAIGIVDENGNEDQREIEGHAVRIYIHSRNNGDCTSAVIGEALRRAGEEMLRLFPGCKKHMVEE